MTDSIKKTITLYAIFIGTAIFLLNQFFFINILTPVNFLNWDAEHYCWISNYGYKDFRVAFFPLFPMIWKFLHLTVYGVVLFNICLFLLSFYFLIRSLKTSTAEILLYLSIPSFCFFALPYSEAVFFAGATILLFGLKKDNYLFVLSGLLVSTLARPAFTVFIPALIIVELVCGKVTSKSVFKIGSYVLISALGLLLVGIIQYHYTGKWFEFFEAQKGWGNKLQLPKFPLTSWAGELTVCLDGAALLIGAIAGVSACLFMFKSKLVESISISKEVLFSLCYLAGISLTVLFFRGGSLFSLNRFVFAVPFLPIALNFYLIQKISFTHKQLIFGFLFIMLFWLSFGSYVHIQAFLRFTILSLYLFLIVFLKSNNNLVQKYSLYLLIAVNVFFQMMFFIRFLNGGWIG